MGRNNLPDSLDLLPEAPMGTVWPDIGIEGKTKSFKVCPKYCRKYYQKLMYFK